MDWLIVLLYSHLWQYFSHILAKQISCQSLLHVHSCIFSVKAYNPAPLEMRGNLMDANLEQDTIRELSLRKQVSIKWGKKH